MFLSVQRTHWILCALILALLGWALGPYLNLPYTDNEGAFVLFGREMSKGGLLYTDIWDHKPPFFFGFSWLLQCLFSLTDLNLHLLGLLIHLLNVFLLFRLAKKLGFNTEGAWASAIGYMLLLFPPLFQPWEVDSDFLVQPLLILSVGLAFSKKPWEQFFSGVIWACAFYTKQSALFLLPIYLVAGAFADIPRILRWVGGASIVLFLTALYFAVTHRWMDFNEAMIGFNQFYVESGWSFFFATEAFRKFLEAWCWVAAAAYGASILLLIFATIGPKKAETHPRLSLFLWGWFFCALVTTSISGYFFSYYDMAFLPPLALGLGLAWEKWRQGRFLSLTLCGAAFLIGTLALGLNAFGARDKVFGYAEYPTDRYYGDKYLGCLISSSALPHSTLLCWADDPQVYVYAGVKPSVKTPFINHLRFMPYQSWKTYQDFIAAPPAFLVVGLSNQVLNPPDWLRAEMKAHYDKVKASPDMALYVHKPKARLK